MDYLIGLIVVVVIYLVAKAVNDSNKRKEFNEVEAPRPEPVKDTRQPLIIDTDAGYESDPDDCQTWISQKTHVMSQFNVLGFVGSSIYGVKSVAFIQQLLDLTGTKGVPVVQGALKSNDLNTVTAGAQFYIDQLIAHDGVEVHIWGSISTLAQALKARPDLAKRISKVYWVASGNRLADQTPYNHLRARHSNDFTLYRDEQAFRAMMRSGDTSKLTALHKYIQASKIGNVWNKYTAELIKKQPFFAGQGWKNGDLTCYLYSINPNLRDRVFKPDTGKWFVADGNAAEQAMAADNVRDWMASRIKANVDLY